MFEWIKRLRDKQRVLATFGYLGDRAHLLKWNSPIDLPVIREHTFAEGLPEPVTFTFYDAGPGRQERGAGPDDHVVIAVVRTERGDWLRTALNLKMIDGVVEIQDVTFRWYVAELLEPTGQVIHTWSQEEAGRGVLQDEEFRELLVANVVAVTPKADLASAPPAHGGVATDRAPHDARPDRASRRMDQSWPIWLRYGVVNSLFAALGIGALVRGAQGDPGNLALAAVMYFGIGYDFVVEYQNRKPIENVPTGAVPLRILIWPVEALFAAQRFVWARRDYPNRFSLYSGRTNAPLDPVHFKSWEDALAAARELAETEHKPSYLVDRAKFVPDGERLQPAFYWVDADGKWLKGWNRRR